MNDLALLSSSSHDLQQQMSHDLDIVKRASSLSSAESSQSLASFGSLLSRLEALVPPAQSTRPHDATVNAIEDNRTSSSSVRDPIRTDRSEDSSDSPSSFIGSHEDSSTTLDESPTSTPPRVKRFTQVCSCCPIKSQSFRTEEELRSDSLDYVEEPADTDQGSRL